MSPDPSGPTKVGFLTNIYTPYKEAMLREMAKLMDLKVYYCAQIEKERDWSVKFSNTYNYEILPGKTYRLGKRNLHFNPGLPARVKQDGIEVMIIGEWANPTVILAPFWLRMEGIPRLLWSGSTALEAAPVRALTDPFKRLIISQYQGYITYTTKAAEYVHALGAPKDKITVAPVTIDTDYFSAASRQLRKEPGRAALRLRHGIAENEIAVIFVGQMIYRKGVDLLIEAVQSLNDPRVKVILAGSGPEREHFEALAAQTGKTGQFVFKGHCTQQELVELYVAGDLFTLPSRKEPSGNVINEAMTVGLPVIISDQIGCDCVTDGSTGFIFTSENVPSYADAFRKLLADADKRREMGKQAVIDIQQGFSIQQEAYQFASALDKTLRALGREFVSIAPLNSQLSKAMSH